MDEKEYQSYKKEVIETIKAVFYVVLFIGLLLTPHFLIPLFTENSTQVEFYAYGSLLLVFILFMFWLLLVIKYPKFVEFVSCVLRKNLPCFRSRKNE